MVGTGVSEGLPDTRPFVGHDHGFTSLGQAIKFFKKLLQQQPKRLSPLLLIKFTI